MVKILYRSIKSGDYSVHLHYFLNGKPKFQQLEIYVTKDYTNGGKIRKVDIEKLELIRKIKTEKEQEILQLKEGASSTGLKEYSCFFDFLDRDLMNKKSSSKSFSNKLEKYLGKRNLPFSRITPRFLIGFFEYIENTGSKRNTAIKYLECIRGVLKRAKRLGIIKETPFSKYKFPTKHRTDITYLELFEVQKLNNTPFDGEPEIKQAFMFSCFTGLRFSDVEKLSYSQFRKEKDEDGQEVTILAIMPKKTDNTSGTLLTLPLSEQAVEILNELSEKAKTAKVFTRFPSVPTITKKLKRWAKDAGINKNLYFHAARHTFATLCISSGIDIYTVKEYLNHSSIEHTEIYATLLSEKLIEEVEKFPDFMDSINLTELQKEVA